MIEDTISRCFSEGCGIPFEPAISSPRFAEILSEELSLSERFPADTDHGAALRAGLLRMGTLLNTLPDDQAILSARQSPLDHIWDFRQRALIRLLGETIIQAADHCLPDEITPLEEAWRNGDADQQIQVAKTLFEHFIGDDQKIPEGELLTWSSARQKINREIRNNLDRDDRRVMPGAYGKWTEQGIPNCQGKAQMLLAFAKRIGARAYCVDTITSAGIVKEIWRDVVARMIREDIENRGIKYVCPIFLESLQAFSYVRSLEKSIPDFFHVGVALQLRDGRWILIDPHGLAWGVIPPAYRMDEVDRLLTKYGRILPGLSFQSHDHKTAARLFGERIGKVQKLFQRSRDLEATLTAASDPMTAFEAFKTFGEPDFIADQEGVSEKIATDPIVRQWFETRGFFGEAFDDLFQILADPDFLQKRIGSLITYYHCQAINLFADQVTAEGKLIHPECEIGLPEHHIAIAMINSLSISDNSTDRSAFFMEHSFDQVTFYNTLSEGMPSWRHRERRPELAEAALQALQSLRLMHSTCRERIETYFKQEK